MVVGVFPAHHQRWILFPSSFCVDGDSNLRGNCQPKEVVKAVPLLKDLTGMKFGDWQVLYRAANRRYNSRSSMVYWRCRCICGHEGDVSATSLVSRKSTRCVRCKQDSMWVSLSKFGAPMTLRERCVHGKYRLSPTEHQAMLAAQSGKCGICSEKVDIHSPVDHNHKCCSGARTCGRCLRGILCKRCNRALGLFRDDLSLLQNAIQYLGEKNALSV